MTNENTTNLEAAATDWTLDEKLDFALASVADEGIHIAANNSARLMRGISDPVQAVAELRELANVIEEYHGCAAREVLLSEIEGRLERIRATPAKRIDWRKEATDLLEEVQAWTSGRDPAGGI